MTCAILQTLVFLLGAWRCRQYPAFLIALECSLPPLWFPASQFWPHMDWERGVWLPCAILLIPMQAVSSLEAAFKFGERYFGLAPRITGTLAIGAIAVSAHSWVWPHGSMAAQVMQVARVQRIVCCLFLVACVALYAIVRWRGLISRVEGAHLILCALLAIPGALVAVMPKPQEWTIWLGVDWPVQARTALLVLWALLVALRQPRQQTLDLAHSAVDPVNFRH